MNHLGWSIAEVSNALRHGRLSATELCETVLQRQKAIASLNAFVRETPDIAKGQAIESDIRYENKSPLGPLDGVPICVKDNFTVENVNTTCGSMMLKDYKPPYSATVVQRLIKAGAILVGKTNLDEFGMGSGTVDSIHGPTKNIHHSGLQYKLKAQQSDDHSLTKNVACLPTCSSPKDWYVAGGSSGGSAVAVAAGAAYVGLGSDTGGSVRNPASYCGVVGLKPSYGIVPRCGLISLVNSMDVPGIFGRYVDDVTAMLGVIAGKDHRDSTSIESNIKNLTLPLSPNVKGLVIGIPQEYHCGGMAADVVEAWTKVADMLEDAGAEVRRVRMPHTQYSIMCYSVLNPAEVASNFTRYTGVEYGHRVPSAHSMEAMYALTRSFGLNEVVRGRVLAGNYFLLRESINKYFRKALKVRRLIWQDFQDVWQSGVDLLLSPVTLSAAIRYSEFTSVDNRTQTANQDICTQAANMAGIPAVSIPVMYNGKGLPLAVQLMAPHGADKEMLTAAKWIEQNVALPRINITHS